MAEPFSALKGTSRKKRDAPTPRVSLHRSNTSICSVNSGRLSLMSNARLQKLISNSSERLSSVGEKDDVNHLENYHLEYSTYLLRKVQSRVLAKDRQEKEENLKKCFVSLKFELEELLDKYVKLSKEIGYFKTFIETIKESNQKIEDGRKLLNVLNKSEFDKILKSLSSALDYTTNQLQLVDFDKNLISEAFSKRILGADSEIDECLKKIDSYVCKNNERVSKLAEELVEVKKLLSENEILKEKFHSIVEKMCSEIIDTYHKVFTDVVKKAFNQREELKNDLIPLSLNCDLGFLKSGVKQPFVGRVSEIGSFLTPNCSSTPQH